jgi:MFS family permease
MLQSASASIESRSSWVVATVALVTLLMAFGGAWITPVALTAIAAEVGGAREVPALASALAWLCSGVGGIVMGRIADRIGTRWTVLGGALMIGLGLAISTLGPPGPLWIGHGVFIGLLGLGGINAPMYIYISRWFDRRRGTALALIWSGQYIAGIVWPTLFEHAMTAYGWRATMAAFAVLVGVAVPIAALFLPLAPPAPPEFGFADAGTRREVLGMRPNTVLAILCVAIFLCCVPMAIPPGHLVAFCSDIGIQAAEGAAMLSVMQAGALTSRIFWGWLSDRVGGLNTGLAASACQALAIAAFLATQNEAGLFLISAAYGLGFSGLIPAYIMAIRELYPSREASWRVPTLLFIGMGGMAFGGWFAGALYDHFGFYAPAFAISVLFNLANLVLIGFLVLRQRSGRALPAMA